MILIVYCIIGSYKKNNIILLYVVSQVDPVRSKRTSINKRPVLSFVHLILWSSLTSIAQFS